LAGALPRCTGRGHPPARTGLEPALAGATRPSGSGRAFTPRRAGVRPPAHRGLAGASAPLVGRWAGASGYAV